MNAKMKLWFAAALVGMVCISANRPATAAIDIDEELRCLALNIYFEARGEPESGKFAVGHVVMNRVSSSRFPETVCNVVRQGMANKRYKCQFSWWCDGASDRPRDTAEWRRSLQLAYLIYVGRSKDPTGGALWYHADYVKPQWRKELKAKAKIGQHIFYVQNASARDPWARPGEGGLSRHAQGSGLTEFLTLDPAD